MPPNGGEATGRQIGQQRVAVPTLAVTAEPAQQLLETEALFGEALDILERRQGHAKIRLTTDGYIGWAAMGDNLLLPPMPEPTHRVASAATFVLAEPAVTSARCCA